MGLFRRRTKTTTAVLKYLLGNPEGTWGLEIAKDCQLTPATVYLMLDRLGEIGIVTSHWEESQRTGPRRRIYQLTENRRLEVEDEIQVAESLAIQVKTSSNRQRPA